MIILKHEFDFFLGRAVIYSTVAALKTHLWKYFCNVHTVFAMIQLGMCVCELLYVLPRPKIVALFQCNVNPHALSWIGHRRMQFHPLWHASCHSFFYCFLFVGKVAFVVNQCTALAWQIRLICIVNLACYLTPLQTNIVFGLSKNVQVHMPAVSLG